MQPQDTFTAISTAERITAARYKWITGNRGLKRTVAFELKESIELVRLHVESSNDPCELFPKLHEEAFRKCLHLNRPPETCRNIP